MGNYMRQENSSVGTINVEWRHFQESNECPLLLAEGEGIYFANKGIECVNCPMVKCFKDYRYHGIRRYHQFLRDYDKVMDGYKNLRDLLNRIVEEW